jgi:hypothetical protein
MGNLQWVGDEHDFFKVSNLMGSWMATILISLNFKEWGVIIVMKTKKHSTHSSKS